MPFDVPNAIDAETAIQVGLPKLRLPISEKAWPVIFLSFAHLTTSHGPCGVLVPPTPEIVWLADDCLECILRKAGDDARGESAEGDKRA